MLVPDKDPPLNDAGIVLLSSNVCYMQSCIASHLWAVCVLVVLNKSTAALHFHPSICKHLLCRETRGAVLTFTVILLEDTAEQCV